MRNIEDLRQASDHVLGGLAADESLKFKILQKASRSGQDASQRLIRAVPVLCSLIVLLVVGIIALSRLQPVDPSSPVEMNVFAAGSKETDHPEKNGGPAAGVFPAAARSVTVPGTGNVSDTEQCAALIRTLLQDAVSSEGIILDSAEQLEIIAEDGTVYRYSVKDPFIAGNGTWSCPGFFRLFRQYTGQPAE